MMHKRMIGASTVLAVLVAAGCGKKGDDKKADDPAKPVEAASAAPAPAPAPAPKAKPADPPQAAPGDPAMPSDDALAAALGHYMGMVEMYAIINKPQQGDKDWKMATDFADALGIPAPQRPDGHSHPEDDTAAALFAKKPRDVGASFVLGLTLMRADWGAILGGVDIGDHLKTIESAATKLQIPDAIWRARLDQVKANPTGKQAGETLDAVYHDIVDYLKTRR